MILAELGGKVGKISEIASSADFASPRLRAFNDSARGLAKSALLHVERHVAGGHVAVPIVGVDEQPIGARLAGRSEGGLAGGPGR